MTSRTSKRERNIGIKHGFRSGLEDKVAAQIIKAGLPLQYETDKVKYTWPERDSTYTPDFRLPKEDGGFIYVETKGIWTVQDRQKHHLVKKQHPDLDIRFVFSNERSKLYKGSRTTYADYCLKFGWAYAHRWIPNDWLAECQQIVESTT